MIVLKQVLFFFEKYHLQQTIIQFYYKTEDIFMPETSNYTQELTDRISPIVDKLFQGSTFYKVRLKKHERIEDLVNLFGELSPEVFRAISDQELRIRIDKLLVLKAVSGTLNDLTPEQLRIFDEAVEGR